MSAVLDFPRSVDPGDPRQPAIELPANVEAEQALLGAILINNDAYQMAAPLVRPEHFIEPLHAELWDLMGLMVAKGEMISPMTLKPYLGARWSEKVGEVPMGVYIVRLMSESSGPYNTRNYAEAVLQAWKRRELFHAAQAMMDEALNARPDVEPEAVAAAASDRILSVINAGADRKGSRQYGDILFRAMQTQQDRAADPTSLIHWFLPEVNDVVGPIRPGNLVGLMSDSGGGKTSFSTSQCRFAAENGVPTAFFSIEVTEEEATLQMAAQRIGVSMGEIDEGNLLRAKSEALFTEAEAGKRLPLVIESFDKADMKEIAARIDMLKKRMGLRFVMIDHAKMIELPGAKGDIFAEKVNGLYRGLKAIAKRTGIAIVILIQRNSDWRNRDNPRPMPSDAYGGGSVIQSLDAFFSLYRPEHLYRDKLETEANDKKRDRYMDVLERTRGFAWIINHKRRRGQPHGQERILFEAPLTLFKSDRGGSSESSELPF